MASRFIEESTACMALLNFNSLLSGLLADKVFKAIGLFTMNVVRSRSADDTSNSMSYRVLAFALLGILINAHGASRGRREWVLRYDGTFARMQAQRPPRQGLTVTIGLGSARAFASGVSCVFLLAACLTARRWLSLPALLLTVSDLLGDVADAVVASSLLLLYSGPSHALLYAFFASVVIALELYLWRGVLRWYEQGLAVHLKALEQQVHEQTAPSVSSSVSSILA